MEKHKGILIIGVLLLVAVIGGIYSKQKREEKTQVEQDKLEMKHGKETIKLIDLLFDEEGAILDSVNEGDFSLPQKEIAKLLNSELKESLAAKVKLGQEMLICREKIDKLVLNKQDQKAKIKQADIKAAGKELEVYEKSFPTFFGKLYKVVQQAQDELSLIEAEKLVSDLLNSSDGQEGDFEQIMKKCQQLNDSERKTNLLMKLKEFETKLAQNNEKEVVVEDDSTIQGVSVFPFDKEKAKQFAIMAYPSNEHSFKTFDFKTEIWNKTGFKFSFSTPSGDGGSYALWPTEQGLQFECQIVSGENPQKLLLYDEKESTSNFSLEEAKIAYIKYYFEHWQKGVFTDGSWICFSSYDEAIYEGQPVFYLEPHYKGGMANDAIVFSNGEVYDDNTLSKEFRTAYQKYFGRGYKSNSQALDSQLKYYVKDYSG